MPSYQQPIIGLTQSHFQLYRDENGLNNAPPLAAVDQWVVMAIGQNFRVRLQIVNEGLQATRYLLEYRVNGGAWRAVDTTEPVRIVDSTVFTDGTATSSRIGYAGKTFVAGEGIDTNRNSADISLSTQQYTEIEWNLRLFSGNNGDTYEFRAVAMTTTWNGGQSYTASPLETYNVYAAVVVGAQVSGGETTMMYEAYTEVGLGIEGSNAFAKWVPASIRVNATTRMPNMQPSRIPIGGFRGIEAPVDYIMGPMPPQPFSLSVEALPDQVGKFLASLFGAPSTSGTGPYTHEFTSSPSPLSPTTLTIWQKEHYRSDEAGNVPLYGGYGGCLFNELTIDIDARTQGPLVCTFGGFAASYILHNSETTTGMNSPYSASLPFTTVRAQLTVRDSSGSTPAWSAEIEQLRLRLLRGGVTPRTGFRNKAIAKGYAMHQRVHLVELSIVAYRVGMRPVKLVLGQAEGASYPILPQPAVLKYAPSSGHALAIEFTSLENANYKLTIATAKFAWIEHSATSGGGDPMMDTFTLVPLATTNGATLSAVTLVNGNSSEPGTAGTPLTISDTGIYSPY
jgi:hypothetical protein